MRLVRDWRNEELVSLISDYSSPVSQGSSPSHNDTGSGLLSVIEQAQRVGETGRLSDMEKDRQSLSLSFLHIASVEFSPQHSGAER